MHFAELHKRRIQIYAFDRFIGKRIVGNCNWLSTERKIKTLNMYSMKHSKFQENNIHPLNGHLLCIPGTFDSHQFSAYVLFHFLSLKVLFTLIFRVLHNGHICFVISTKLNVHMTSNWMAWKHIKTWINIWKRKRRKCSAWMVRV